MSDNENYNNYQSHSAREHELLCKRCGACCGVMDNDPCRHLKIDKENKYFCEIYEERFGERKTIKGRLIKCVPIRNILHKTWPGRANCAYVKAYKNYIKS